MTRCFVAFGGNLGPVAETFRAAVKELGQTPGVRVEQRSRLYQTAAIGSTAGSAYLNAVAAIETSMSPDEFLSVLQTLEARFGRVRSAYWGPRTLDLDLLAFGNLVQSSPRLSMPHPHCWYRRFALDPWCDVAPDFVHPILRESVAEMKQRLLARPLPITVDPELGDVRARLATIPELRIVADDAGESTIRFVIGQNGPRHRTIDLSTAADAPAFAEQITHAALDEPTVIASDDWMSASGERPLSAG